MSNFTQWMDKKEALFFTQCYPALRIVTSGRIKLTGTFIVMVG